MPIVLKSGSLNLLEPSGPVQACNGIALPLHIGTSFLKEGVLSVMIPLSFLKITFLYYGIKLLQSYVKSGTCLSKWSQFNHFRKHLKRIQDLPEKEQKGGKRFKTIEDIFNPVFFCSFHSHSLRSSQREVTTYSVAISVCPHTSELGLMKFAITESC